MKKPTQHIIAETPWKRGQVELTIGIDLDDVWSHYCTLNQHGDVLDRARFRTTPKAIDKWFVDVPHARVAMEAGVDSIWISEQLEQLGHEVIAANVRELRAISHSDRRSDDVYTEKLARYARVDPEHVVCSPDISTGRNGVMILKLRSFRDMAPFTPSNKYKPCETTTIKGQNASSPLYPATP